MNKNLSLLLATSLLLISCDNNNSSSVISSSSDSSESISSESISSESISSESTSIQSEESSKSEDETSQYEKIINVNELFETYETKKDYNFIAKYRVDALNKRTYADGWETDYMFDGYNIQLDYESDGTYYTDYYICQNEETEEYVYYLDMSGGEYKYLTADNDYFGNYVSTIDYFELAGIDFENDCLIDKENKKIVPKDNEAKTKIGRLVFGNNQNEYWHDISFNYDNGYLTHVSAISLLRNITYYYEVEIIEHGYAAIKAPKDASEYKNPYQPYLRGADVNTSGVALNQKQKDALNIFSKESDMNYTIKSTWTYVYNNKVYEEYQYEFDMLACNGNYYYSYVDSSYGLTTKYYLLSLGEGKYPAIFYDDDYDGKYEGLVYDGTSGSDYTTMVSSVYIDRVLFYDIDPDDFLYNEEKGYIFPKDEECEEKYCGKLFFYQSSYGGVRIYLKDDGANGLILDKIDTSMYVSSDSSITSYIKTYTFTNINETVIEYPEGVEVIA